MKYLIIISLLISSVYCESALLRSKYLKDKMIENISELDKYERVARRIFNRYEKAKFYQMVAYVYSEKYEDLVRELDVLEKQYMSIMNDYSDKVDFSFINNLPTPAIKNEFSPILFSKDNSINVKMFKAKAGLFKKQYYEFVGYFNNRLFIFENQLNKVKGTYYAKDIASTYNKIYDEYDSFVLDFESYDQEQANFSAISDTNNLLLEINWSKDSLMFKRKFEYFKNSSDIKKTLDIEDNKIIMEVTYDIKNDEFVKYILKEFEDLDASIYQSLGNFSVKYFNDVNNVYQVKYFFSNGEPMGCIIKNFQEELELIDEVWYIGDCDKKVRKLTSTFYPEKGKNILFENRFK